MIKRLKKVLKDWNSKRTRRAKVRQMVERLTDAGIIRQV